MINQIDLLYFTELANTLHLTRAAERIGISQPALSHSLKRLEEEIGATLFIRSKKGMKLTPAGSRLRESASKLMRAWSDVKSDIQNDSEQPIGEIRLGCHSAVAQYTLPLFLQRFLAEYPEITIKLTHGLSRHVTEQVVSEVLDIAIAVNPIANPDLIIKELFKDDVCVWQAKKNMNPDVLIIEPSLLQTQDILRKMNKSGFNFRRVIESSSLEVISSLVTAGVGCGVIPERVLRAHGGERFEKLKGSPEFHDRICLVYKKEFRRLKRGKVFLEAASTISSQ